MGQWLEIAEKTGWQGTLLTAVIFLLGGACFALEYWLGKSICQCFNCGQGASRRDWGWINPRCPNSTCGAKPWK